MKNIEFSALEKEAANFDFKTFLEADASVARNNIAAAESVADVKEQICKVWRKIRKFVKMAEVVPIVGKFITILADLLDTICETA